MFVYLIIMIFYLSFNMQTFTRTFTRPRLCGDRIKMRLTKPPQTANAHSPARLTLATPYKRGKCLGECAFVRNARHAWRPAMAPLPVAAAAAARAPTMALGPAKATPRLVLRSSERKPILLQMQLLSGEHLPTTSPVSIS